MTEPEKKSFITLHVTKHEDGLQHFARKGVGPAWMLGAHFIDKLPAILRNAAWIGVALATYWKVWP